MDILAPILVILVLAAVVWLVSAPLRAKAAGRQPPAERRDAQRRRDLEIERDQKYAEIRELEMDLRTGKLNDADYKATDRQLRAEAVNILHRLDELGSPAEPEPEPEQDEPEAEQQGPETEQDEPDGSRPAPDA